MGNYCLVDEGKIIEGPKALSVNWKNISNLPALSDELQTVLFKTKRKNHI